MELPVASGVVAEAEYWPGEADLPAVLVVHDFLQTREVSTVRRLAEALADQGFSVLTPSLTLGFSRRQQGVACEALHTHSMQQDIAELRAWTVWLTQRSGKPPVLIGHSAGGVHLSAMLEANRDLDVAHAVLIGLSHFGEGLDAPGLAALRARALSDLASTTDLMQPYALTYCRSYVTTPANLLSYLQWDKDRLARALATSPVPVTVIYGERDSHIDTAWLEGLRSSGATLWPVAGASHFFGFVPELELVDEVLQVITGASHG
jgi:dienelactone hydrolase